MQNAGTEVVDAKAGAGSATLSMAYAAYLFATACLKAMNGFAGIVECAYVEDASIEGCDFFAQRVKLGKTGIVHRCVLPHPVDVSSARSEAAALVSSAVCVLLLAVRHGRRAAWRSRCAAGHLAGWRARGRLVGTRVLRDRMLDLRRALCGGVLCAGVAGGWMLDVSRGVQVRRRKAERRRGEGPGGDEGAARRRDQEGQRLEQVGAPRCWHLCASGRTNVPFDAPRPWSSRQGLHGLPRFQQELRRTLGSARTAEGPHPSVFLSRPHVVTALLSGTTPFGIGLCLVFAEWRGAGSDVSWGSLMGLSEICFVRVYSAGASEWRFCDQRGDADTACEGLPGQRLLQARHTCGLRSWSDLLWCCVRGRRSVERVGAQALRCAFKTEHCAE